MSLNEQISVKVFKPSSQSALKTIESLPESYFAPTTHELAVAHTSQSRARERLTDAPMLTKRLRDEKSAKAFELKKQKYPQARIRVKFPDQTMIESSLPSTSRLDAVYNFTSSTLDDQAQQLPYFLYQTPPRREFKQDDPKVATLTLLELDLAPSAMLYIKFEEPALNDGSKPPPLKPSLLETIQELPNAPSTKQDQSPGSSKDSDAESARDLTGKSGKVPKWLSKIGKK